MPFTLCRILILSDSYRKVSFLPDCT